MTSDEQAGPDPYAEHPEESAFPGAGNATVGDMVDTDQVDSSAHEEGAGSEEVAEQVDGGHQAD